MILWLDELATSQSPPAPATPRALERPIMYMDSSVHTSEFFDQTKGAYVYSAFWWRCYLLALNVCAPRFLYESAPS